MYDFSYPLGNAVKSTRYQRGLTQLQVADMEEAEALIPVVESVIAALRTKDAIEIG